MFVSQSSNNVVTASANVGTLTIPVPPNIVAGNTLYAVIYQANSTCGPITSTGWTYLGSAYANTGGASAPSGNLTVLTKTATGSEPASYDFLSTLTFAQVDYLAGNIGQYSDASSTLGATPLFNIVTTSTANMTAPSVNPSSAGTLLSAFGTFNGKTLTAPSGMVSRSSSINAGNISEYLFDQAVSGGATGTKTSTLNSSDTGVSVSFVVSDVIIVPDKLATGDTLLTEDGNRLLLEDGSGFYLLDKLPVLLYRYGETWTDTNGQPWSPLTWVMGLINGSAATVQNNRGQMITPGATFTTGATAYLSDMAAIQDIDVTVELNTTNSAEQYPTVAVRTDGVMGTGVQPNNCYYATCSPAFGIIEFGRVTAGAKAVFGQTQFGTGGVATSLRIRVSDKQLQVRAWITGQSEPTNWNIADFTDYAPLYTAGKVMLNGRSGNGVSNTISWDNLVVSEVSARSGWYAVVSSLEIPAIITAPSS